MKSINQFIYIILEARTLCSYCFMSKYKAYVTTTFCSVYCACIQSKVQKKEKDLLSRVVRFTRREVLAI
jgi:hypothetical protein